MLKKLTMLLLVAALVWHTAVPAVASEYKIAIGNDETELPTTPTSPEDLEDDDNNDDTGSKTGDTGSSNNDDTGSNNDDDTGSNDTGTGNNNDTGSNNDDTGSNNNDDTGSNNNDTGSNNDDAGSSNNDPIVDPEEPGDDTDVPEARPAIIDEDGDDDKNELDWEESFLRLQNESVDTFERVSGYFDTLFLYLLENHLLNERAFEVYFILYEEFLDLFVINSEIQISVIQGDLTHREGVRRLRANIAAMESMIPRVQNFDPGDPDASLVEDEVEQNGTDYNNVSNGGAGGIENGGSGGNGRFRLPQTGATIASFALAGIALLGSGTTAVLFKKRKQIDEQFDLGDLL